MKAIKGFFIDERGIETPYCIIPRMAYGHEQTKPDAPAERGTREADEQDAYGYRRPVIRERIAAEDRTLTGGYLNEEVREAIRTGRAPHEGVADAARNFATPWLLGTTELPQE